MSDLIDILIPEGQLEGTSAVFAAWLVEAGSCVSKGQPLAELETDKVVMEVCASQAGVVAELLAKKGDKVAPEQCLGKIRAGGAAVQSDPEPASVATAAEKREETAPVETGSGNDRHLLSPAVRRLLKENNLAIERIQGSGRKGRVTRDDVLAYINEPSSEYQVRSEDPVEYQVEPKQTSPFAIDSERPRRPLQGKKVAHSPMRKSIAHHMVESLLLTSPHVTSVFEMDMSNLIEHRKWHKKEFEQMGVKLTFTAYFMAAMAKAVKQVPQVNARFHADSLELFDDVNIGIGTALGDSGLVVPVIEQVQSMDLFEIALRLGEMTEKARNGKLTSKDMSNGSITISNHGVSGSLFATPIIINQPQVAILGVGKLEKRVVVRAVNGTDTLVIKPMCYVSLSIDHRALDAHQTNLFLSHFVNTIETWGE